MRTDLPNTIVDTIHELSPEAIVRLFKLTLQDGTIIRMSPQGEVTWQGDVYDAIPCHMTEISQDADGKVSRPKFSFANPEGIFSAEVYNRRIENAEICRYRILKSDLDADMDFKITETFRISRVMSLGKDIVSAELRDVLDGHQFKLPARSYYPPEFPHVKLS